MGKLRVNYTMCGTSLTGGVRVIFEIANQLVHRGHHVTITTLGNPKNHKWFPLEAEINYVPQSSLGKATALLATVVPRVNVDPFSSNDIKKLSEKIPDCDINVATFCFTAFSVFESNKGVSFYHMQHYEPLFFENQHAKAMAEVTYYLPLAKITNSTWLKNQMKERYGYDLPVVNPAIDHGVFYRRESTRNTKKYRVLCFAKQLRLKGFPEALEAMRIVMSKRADVEFVTYGLGQPTYESKVPYTFVKAPSDDDLARLYSSADVVICPSWYESFPLFPLEAMACGAPIVTTPYGTEDYAFHEKNCFVVPPRDTNSLADATLRLLGDESLRERFRREGPKTAKLFTWERTTDKVEKLFVESLQNV